LLGPDTAILNMALAEARRRTRSGDFNAWCELAGQELERKVSID
jgi:hypothetical protein